MREELPFHDARWTFLLFPAWPAHMDPDLAGSGGSAGLLADEFAQSAVRHFSFLLSAGFELAAADDLDRGGAPIVPFFRDDAAVLVGASMVGMFVIVAPPLGTARTARAAVEAASATDPALVAVFGSFPLPADGDALNTVVGRGAENFHAAAHQLLAERPADLKAIADVLASARERLRFHMQAAYYRAQAAAAFDAGRFAVLANSLESLGHVDRLTDEELTELAYARSLAAGEPPTLVRGDAESNRDWTARRAEHVRSTLAAFEEADRQWAASPDGVERRANAEQAVAEAFALMYPDDFWDNLRALQAGDAAQVDPAIDYLEADPWHFRSGYVKEEILRYLPRHNLSFGQAQRLEVVLLRAVDVGDRREFRRSCRLARHLRSPELRRQLHARLRSVDHAVARRALWMLLAIRRPRFRPDEVDVVRALVRESAGQKRGWWASLRWVRPLMPMIASAEWATALVNDALGDAEATNTDALRLLPQLPNLALTPKQSSALAARVLGVVDNGGDGSWLEAASRLVSSPGFADTLLQRHRGPDSDVRRRAWLALRAIGHERPSD
jgi:hypothetical protein